MPRLARLPLVFAAFSAFLLSAPCRADADQDALQGIAKVPNISNLNEGGKVTGVWGIGPKVTDKTVAEVMKYRAGLGHLDQLYLQQSSLTDEGMKEVCDLPRLTTLWFAGSSGLTDKGIAQLKGFPKMRSLSLDDTRATGTGLKPEAMPELEELILRSCPVTTDGLKVVASFKKLQSVDLSWTRVRDISPLKHLANLAYLDVRDTDVTDESMAALDNKTLETLNANTTKLTGAGLKNLKGLRQVDLRSTRVNDEGLAGLAGAAALKWLMLSDTNVTDAGLKHLGSLEKLEWLELKGTKVTGSGIKDLRGCKSLTSLQLSPGQITDEALAALVEMQKLHILTGVSPRGKKATDVDIVCVDLSRSRVTDAGLKTLHGLNSLKNLNVHKTEITDEGIAELKKVLPNLKVHR